MHDEEELKWFLLYVDVFSLQSHFVWRCEGKGLDEWFDKRQDDDVEFNTYLPNQNEKWIFCNQSIVQLIFENDRICLINQSFFLGGKKW